MSGNPEKKGLMSRLMNNFGVQDSKQSSAHRSLDMIEMTAIQRRRSTENVPDEQYLAIPTTSRRDAGASSGSDWSWGSAKSAGSDKPGPTAEMISSSPSAYDKLYLHQQDRDSSDRKAQVRQEDIRKGQAFLLSDKGRPDDSTQKFKDRYKTNCIPLTENETWPGSMFHELRKTDFIRVQSGLPDKIPAYTNYVSMKGDLVITANYQTGDRIDKNDNDQMINSEIIWNQVKFVLHEHGEPGQSTFPLKNIYITNVQHTVTTGMLEKHVPDNGTTSIDNTHPAFPALFSAGLNKGLIYLAAQHTETFGSTQCTNVTVKRLAEIIPYMKLQFEHLD